MRMRRKLNRRKSRKMFSRGASRTHRFNRVDNYVMRGGYRL